ncbi:MAG: TonB-dependent receptor [Pseudomonadota bacterium]
MPEKEDHAEVSVRLTTLPGASAQFDVGGGLLSDEQLRYRMVGIYRNEDNVADYTNPYDRIFLAPSFAIDVNENHKVSLWFEYLDESFPLDANNPIGTNGEILIPQERITSHPDNEGEKSHFKIGFDVNSYFGNWTSNLKFVHNDFENFLLPFVINFPFFAETNTINRIISEQTFKGKENLIALTVNGEFELLGLRNRITIGGDYFDSDSGFGAAFRGVAETMDIFDTDFDYGELPEPVDPQVNFIERKQTGVFVQNHLSLTNQFILSFGLRYDDYEAEDTDTFESTTPQLGLLYKVNDDISVYANYSESFTPNTVFEIDGTLLDPETGEGNEIGIRYSISEKINMSAAYFDIEKVNVAVPDPADPFNFFIASGAQTSEGIEVDMAGNITDDWSMVASYGYVDTEDKAANPGNALLNMPKHTASLFTQHTLAFAGLPDFTLGGGFRHIGNMFVVDPGNSVELPSATVFDLNITYQKGPWTAILTVQNLGDKEYVENATFSSAITSFGAPRNAFLSVLYDF